MDRRRFLSLGAALTLTSGLMPPVGRAAAGGPSVRRTSHRVEIGLGTSLRVAQLTDIHLGLGTPEAVIRQALELTRAAVPDLVVLTGDYVNVNLRRLPELRAMLAALPRPCIATLGNHDWQSGGQEVAATLRAAGVEVLLNESTIRDLGRTWLEVVGVDDAFSRRAEPRLAFARVRAPDRCLVLTHDPRIAAELTGFGPPLVLAGHTHGGGITALGRSLGGTAVMPYRAGWYQVEETRLYVNVGLGSTVPGTRTGPDTVPEVAVFELT